MTVQSIVRIQFISDKGNQPKTEGELIRDPGRKEPDINAGTNLNTNTPEGMTEKIEVTEATEELNGYEAYTIDYALTEKYHFPWIQVKGMENEKLQQKINDSLKEKLYIAEMLGFAERKYRWTDPIIHLQSPQYLSTSIVFFYGTAGNETGHHELAVTVNMKTGELVYLDDLIEFDEQFALLIKNGGIIRENGGISKTQGTYAKRENEQFAEYEPSFILALFSDMTKEWLYNIEFSRNNGTLHYFGRYYFYLEKGKIVYAAGGWVKYEIETTDLTDVLKVEEW